MEKIGKQESYSLEEIDNIVENIDKRNPRIKLADFYDTELFTKEHIDHDIEDEESDTKEFTEQKKRLSPHQRERMKIAEFVEVSIPEAIKNLGWLGEKVKVIRPSKWDDYKRGIDNVIQMLPEEVVEDEKDLKCIGFSIDFTISEKSTIDKAFEVSLAIARGKVPSMQYFSTSIKTKDGEKDIKIRDFKIPRIIMSCPDEILNKSKNDLLNYEKNPDDEKSVEKAKDSALRYHFIRETLSQLEFFANLSDEVKNEAAGKIYRDSLEQFTKIIDEQGIDDEMIKEKTGRSKGLISAFDLEANDGQWLKILKYMAAQK